MCALAVACSTSGEDSDAGAADAFSAMDAAAKCPRTYAEDHTHEIAHHCSQIALCGNGPDGFSRLSCIKSISANLDASEVLQDVFDSDRRRCGMLTECEYSNCVVDEWLALPVTDPICTFGAESTPHSPDDPCNNGLPSLWSNPCGALGGVSVAFCEHDGWGVCDCLPQPGVPFCGNGRVEGDERCDPPLLADPDNGVLGVVMCVDLMPGTQGQVGCGPFCRYDTRLCVPVDAGFDGGGEDDGGAVEL